jgi:hypothetical protein
MTRYQDTVRCNGCGREITWSPVVAGTLHYCCQDCMQGYRCECPDQLEPEDERRPSGVTTVDSTPDYFS